MTGIGRNKSRAAAACITVVIIIIILETSEGGNNRNGSFALLYSGNYVSLMRRNKTTNAEK